MNRMSILTVTTLGALAMSTQARAEQRLHVPGLNCVPTEEGDDLARGAYGAINQAGTSKHVWCPLQFSSSSLGPQTIDPGEARLHYFAPSGGGEAWLTCNPTLIKGTTASTVSMGSRASCSTAGGCSSAGTIVGGIGYITWGDTVSSTSDISGIYFDCTLGSSTEIAVHSYGMRVVSP